MQPNNFVVNQIPQYINVNILWLKIQNYEGKFNSKQERILQ